MADTPQQAQLRAQLRARGDQLAPRVGEPRPTPAPDPQPGRKPPAGQHGRPSPGRGPGTRPARARQRAGAGTPPVSRGARRDGKRPRSPRDVGRGLVRGASKVTTRRRRYTPAGLLTAELLTGAGIVVLRMVADYEPQADGTLRGRVGHPKGQYGPFPILAGLLVIFFLLSFLAQQGGPRAKVAVIAGGLIDLVLAMKSLDEINRTAATFSHFGQAHVPPGDWQTSGTPAGEPVTTTTTSGDGSGKPSMRITRPPEPM
jgi:hypothetical protein